MTQYIGKIIGNRVLVICENKNGDKIQIPHVDMMAEDGLSMIAYNGTPKEPYKYLSKKEVALFLNGRGIDGSILETPAQMKKRFEREMAEMMNDPKFRAIIEEIRNERSKK